MTVTISWQDWNEAEKNNRLSETLGALAGINPSLYNPAKKLPDSEKLQAAFRSVYDSLSKPFAVGDFINTQGTHELAIIPAGFSSGTLTPAEQAYLSFAEFTARYIPLHAQKRSLEETVAGLEQAKSGAEEKLAEIETKLQGTTATLKAPKNLVSKTQSEKDLSTCNRRKEHFSEELEECMEKLEQARKQASAVFEDAGLRAAYTAALRDAPGVSSQFYYELLDYGTAAGIAEDKSLASPGISPEVIATITASCQPKTFTYSIKHPERDTTKVLAQPRSGRKIGAFALTAALSIGALTGTWFLASHLERKQVLADIVDKPRLDTDTTVWWLTCQMKPGTFIDDAYMRQCLGQQTAAVLGDIAVRLNSAELYATEAAAIAGRFPVQDQNTRGAYRVELTTMASEATETYVVPCRLFEDYQAVCLDVEGKRLPVRVQRSYRASDNSSLTEVLIACPSPRGIAKLANWKGRAQGYTHVGFIFGSDRRGPMGEVSYAASSERNNYDPAPSYSFEIPEPGEAFRFTAYAFNKEGSIAQSRKKLLASGEYIAPGVGNAADLLPLIKPVQQ